MPFDGRSYRDVLADKRYQYPAQTAQRQPTEPRNLRMQTQDPEQASQTISPLLENGTEQVAMPCGHTRDLAFNSNLASDDEEMLDFSDILDFSLDPANLIMPTGPSPVEAGTNSEYPGNIDNDDCTGDVPPAEEAYLPSPHIYIQDVHGQIQPESYESQSVQDAPSSYHNHGMTVFHEHLSTQPNTYGNDAPILGTSDGRAATGPWPWTTHAMHPVSRSNPYEDQAIDDGVATGSQPSFVSPTFSVRPAATSMTSCQPSTHLLSNRQDPHPVYFQRRSYADVARGNSQGLLSPEHARIPGPLSPQWDAMSSIASSPASVYSTTSSGPSVLRCTQCDKEYTSKNRKGSLARHMRHKHPKNGAKVYDCGHCNHAPFKRQDARLRHWRDHHPELEIPAAISRKKKN